MERLLVLQIVGLGTIIKVISVFCVQLIVSLVSMLIFVAVVSLGFIYMEGFVKVRALMGSTYHWLLTVQFVKFVNLHV